MRDQTQLRQERGGSTWQQAGVMDVGDGLNVPFALQNLSPGKCTALSSPLLALTDDDNNRPRPQETSTKQTTMTLTMTDEHIAENRRARPQPRTTTYHHDTRATTTDDNAPPTVTTMNRMGATTPTTTIYILPAFAQCTLVDALLLFLLFSFPGTSCGRVATFVFQVQFSLFTSVYQCHLRPQSHPKKVCCIQLFQPDLTEGNYLKWPEHYQGYNW